MAARGASAEDLFTALAHPLRRRVLRAMLDRGRRRESSPCDLAEELEEKLTAVAYHMRVLADCDAIELVRTERDGVFRRHFYRAAIKAKWALMALAAE